LRARRTFTYMGWAPRMREAGVELVADCAEVSLVESSKLPRTSSCAESRDGKPDRRVQRRRPRLRSSRISPAFICARAELKRQGVQNIYFVCPQFWACGRGARTWYAVDSCAGLHFAPSSRNGIARAGYRRILLGTLGGNVAAKRSREEFAAFCGLDSAKAIVALLPGSRAGEIAHHMPPLVQSCHLIAKSHPVQFVLALSPGMSKSQISFYLKPESRCAWWKTRPTTHWAAADVAIVSSGTATVERR